MFKILKRTFALSMLICLISCTNTTNQSGKTLKLSESFVTQVEQGQIEAAFEMLKAHWPMSNVEVDNLKNHTMRQRKVVVSRYGEPQAVEFVKTELVGKSLVRHTFIEKFESHALKWELSFYKNKGKWLISTVYWDDEISTLFKG
tara:strand:- start:32196 stop:32630 length:435 start_codon:yes stop_codon:yes gene_type:complete